eukprot:g3047.t1
MVSASDREQILSRSAPRTERREFTRGQPSCVRQGYRQIQDGGKFIQLASISPFSVKVSHDITQRLS